MGCHGWFLPSESRSNAVLSLVAVSRKAVRIAAVSSGGRLDSIAVGGFIISSDFRTMRKSSLFIGEPSAFFNMPFFSMRVRFESSSAFHQLAECRGRLEPDAHAEKGHVEERRWLANEQG